MIKIDVIKRQVIITNSITKNVTVINEFDKIKKKFLDNTEDKYECELILLDVPLRDELNNKDTDQFETKAFARRLGFSNWLELFNEEDFII